MMNLNITELKSKSLKVNGTYTETYTEYGCGSESDSGTINASFTK